MRIGETLKQLRLARGLTQQELAEKVGTTQQSIARWEKDAAQPRAESLAKLSAALGWNARDIFQVSNPELIKSIDKDDEYYWGHFGVRLVADERTRWFPITEAECERVFSLLRSGTEKRWLIVETLDNQALLIQPDLVEQILLLDEDADPPENDWSIPKAGYSGHHRDVYKCAENIALDLSKSKEGFSEDTIADALAVIEKLELGDADKAIDFFCSAKIFLKNGKMLRYYISELCAKDIFVEMDSDFGDENRPVYLHDEHALHGFFPKSNVAMISLPLLLVNEGFEADARDFDEK